MTETDKQKSAAKKVRDEANEADMTSSPALNDDAETDGGQAGKQSLPDGNRFD
ncbi:hypothetical protein GCM10007853_23680 [Algimonas ampicilliniresistens]|uniref:Uncharacterized protein n=1 Tax=Algimonas ampicilliniresistens TaxID=1298735 RepID=A0ABQ5VCS8_9PROT|nr:hypothetical protein [Algimonas ampicilliniresistens]GLQ24494.1 hypothetical protein GCM10007853_23680 [Algimonas ampicilliniresistens]